MMYDMMIGQKVGKAVKDVIIFQVAVSMEIKN